MYIIQWTETLYNIHTAHFIFIQLYEAFVKLATYLWYWSIICKIVTLATNSWHWPIISQLWHVNRSFVYITLTLLLCANVFKHRKRSTSILMFGANIVSLCLLIMFLWTHHRPFTVTSYILSIIVTYLFICTNLVSFLAVGCSWGGSAYSGGNGPNSTPSYYSVQFIVY